jgi:hypothetical protein
MNKMNEDNRICEKCKHWSNRSGGYGICTLKDVATAWNFWCGFGEAECDADNEEDNNLDNDA